jgi:hypothetical protein
MDAGAYDNFLNSYKRKLWDKCLENNIFDEIPESELANTKTVFENSIQNHKTQILQNDGNDLITNTLLSNIKSNSQHLKMLTRQQLSEQKLESFESAMKTKQQEFDSLITRPVPKVPEFSDGVCDEPLDNENLESLIKEQMKDRELAAPNIPNVAIPSSSMRTSTTNNMSLQGERNVVLGQSNISSEPTSTPSPPPPNFSIMQQHNQHNNEVSMFQNIEQIRIENGNLKLEIQELKIALKKQTDILDKIVNSQIVILKKIK